MIFSHESEPYASLWLGLNASKFNGAYYYSREIVRNIIPNVETDRNWVTVLSKGMCFDHSVVFIHNNDHPRLYQWMKDYKDLILVCGVPTTCAKVGHLGKAVYLPLSVDVAEVEQYRCRKDKGTCYVGRRGKRRGASFEKGTEYVEGLPREELLAELARYRRVYAVGRCAIEARVLGCEILSYDKRYPDPSVWKVLDNMDAAQILQGILDEEDM